MTTSSDNVVQRLWGLCNILRGDGVGYNQYISELTYLLFLKIAEETGAEALLPEGYQWKNLVDYEGSDLLAFYQEMLTHLGGHASSKAVREIYAFPTTVFSHSENLKAVVDGIAKIDWHSISKDGIGDIYEGLLGKNSQDARSGAGQYFTPRALVDCMVNAIAPKVGERIQDPASGTGGFLISADLYVRTHHDAVQYRNKPPQYQGMEIEKSTYRLCLMNAFLHGIEADIILGDALTEDASALRPADVILANPPFGARAGSRRKRRQDLNIVTSNKQLEFLQHIYLGLKKGGRAAVVLPDNVLFEGGAGKKVRQMLMDLCNLHTVLRLPQGIFYSAGVQTNVLFFERGSRKASNTEAVAYYDMRTNGPSYGRRRPLISKDFDEFKYAYRERPAAQAIESGRWRIFSREEIAARDDNLDVSWLASDVTTLDEVSSDPQAVLATMIEQLRAATSEAESLADELDVITSEVEASA